MGAKYSKSLLLDEGNHCVATNPTLGTGVAYAGTTAFSDTTALFTWQNTSATKVIIPDRIRLVVTAAAATVTSIHFASKLDNVSRAPSAGNAARTGVNSNGASTVASVATFNAFSAAAMTVPASGGSARTVSRGTIPSGIDVALDEYVIQFGMDNDQTSIQGLTGGTRSTQPA